ncbi:hypothetical protein [Streptomyces sediminimaris]|uniref:hypothetical protein n=1 Tax=Streptomyces sediminimaris TaxID=3383721 RepID=UPI00399AB52F
MEADTTVSHRFEQGVLVIDVHRDPGAAGQAALAAEIGHLVRAHEPVPAVVVLDEQAASRAAVRAVLSAHRMCNRLGVLMSVATHSAPARRQLEANADTGGTRLVVHARADIAVAVAFTAAA